MDLLKYTKFGFYIKLVSSILAVLFFPLMFFSGFFDNEVANSDKGWNFIAGFFLSDIRYNNNNQWTKRKR